MSAELQEAFANDPCAVAFKSTDVVGRREVRDATVVGFQVGRFAVRPARFGEVCGEPGDDRPMRAWVVTHINSGMWVFDCDREDVAYRIADDVSRFSKRDPSARDSDRASDQIGDDVIGWLDDVEDDADPIGFRDWLAQKGSD